MKFAVLFIALALLIVFGITYFAFTKTVIFLTTQETPVKTTFEVQIAEKVPEGADATISGAMLTTTESVSQEFTVSDVTSTVPDYATGNVTIHNEYSQTQSLVSTTRLLSSEGVLFRTTETIRVEPDKTVNVPVRADAIGEGGNIPASRFTIVALWPGIQDKIYGTSDTSMTGGLREIRALTEEELTASKETVTQLVEEKAKARLQELLAQQYPDFSFNAELLTETASEVAASQEVNDEVDAYTVDATLSATGFAIDKVALEKISEARLLRTLPIYQKILPNTLTSEYTVTRIDEEKNEATVKVRAGGKADLLLNHPLFDKSKLTNMDTDDLRAYFSDIPEIVNIDVTFSPFWSFKTPRLPDHITIELTRPGAGKD